MGLIASIREALRRAGDAGAERAAKASAAAAAESVAKAVDAAGDELAGQAEAMLDRSRKDREGRPDYLPDAESADEIARKVEEAARRPAPGRPSTPAPDREARARAELERLKAERGTR